MTVYTGTTDADSVSLDEFYGDQSRDPMNITSLGGDDVVNARVGVDEGAASLTIDAGSGDDDITAAVRGDGDAGEDRSSTIVVAGSGDDTVDAGAIAYGQWGKLSNYADGGSGDDVLSADLTSFATSGTINLSNALVGGTGNDVLSAIIRLYGPLDESASVLVVQNALQGGSGDDKLSAQILVEDPDSYRDNYPTSQLFGGGGDDTLSVRGGAGNLLEGGNGDDRLSAKDSDGNSLYGGAGDDRLSVRGGDGNILNGGTGSDTLLGSAGSDTLIGLGGDDYLRGRGGDDIFLFGAIRNGEQDRIVDFVIGEDKIDLSQIDANTSRGGNQDFTFGTREGTGRVWIEDASRGSSSVLHADTGTKVLTVVIQDGADVGIDAYHASDFLL